MLLLVNHKSFIKQIQIDSDDQQVMEIVLKMVEEDQLHYQDSNLHIDIVKLKWQLHKRIKVTKNNKTLKNSMFKYDCKVRDLLKEELPQDAMFQEEDAYPVQSQDYEQVDVPWYKHVWRMIAYPL